ncbi:hypothetical protein GH714_019156 [Hevea brasiliensis]|uniref:RNase H type-1 domain-containing protein n=1 Tax=Hevea brasiliensis TaxID=3981 RepID=A0A6A6L6X9_HEVBR|nr:hypothetical protein GH714_019156 [Hevea brasiliensis]
MAEASALLEGLVIAWDKGNRKIIVECDNESVVHFALGLREPPGHVKTLIGRIKGLSRRDWETKSVALFVGSMFCRDLHHRCWDGFCVNSRRRLVFPVENKLMIISVKEVLSIGIDKAENYCSEAKENP